MVVVEVSCLFRLLGFVCACMVVGIHAIDALHSESRFLYSFLRDGIFRVAVPVFFYISGYLLYHKAKGQRWWINAIRRRCFTLVIPYFIWMTFWVVSHICLKYGNVDFKIELFTWYGFNPFERPILHPFWYIRNLWLLVIISPLYVWMFSKKATRKFLFVLLLFIIYVAVSPFEGPGEVLFRRFFSVEGSFYFGLGMYSASGGLNIRFRKKILGYTTLIMFVSLMSLKVCLEVNNVAGYRYVGCIGVLSGVVCMINLGMGYSMPKSLSSLSFPIFAIHYFIINFLVLLGERFRVFSDVSIMEGLGFVFVVMFCSCCVVMLLKKILPRWANVILWGGR